MIRLTYILLCLLVFTLANAQNKPLQIIPQPVDMKLQSGFFALTKSTTVSFDQPTSEKVSQLLVHRLTTATGFSFKLFQGKTGSIQLNLNTLPDQTLGDEGYTLVSTTKNLAIKATYRYWA